MNWKAALIAACISTAFMAASLMGQPSVLMPITVAQLPTCDSATLGSLFAITDGSSWSDCSGGSGTSNHPCVCTFDVTYKWLSIATVAGVQSYVDPMFPVELGTNTNGNYVSSATASQGLTMTGGEGGSLGIQDCAANEIMQRNADDTAWACSAVSAGGGDNISVNGSAATDANFTDGDIDFVLSAIPSPDTITATVECSGCVAAGDIASDAVTEAKLKAVDAASDEQCLTYETTTGDFEWQTCETEDVTNNRLLGRAAVGAGAVQEIAVTGGLGFTAGDLDITTPSTTLDKIGSTRGSVLYRGAGGWSALAPGTSGYLLMSNGAGADPSYGAPSTVRPPSVLNPRSSPSSSDCEFSSGVCANWTLDGSFSSGTVDPTASVASFIYDATSWPGWLLFQGDNSSATSKNAVCLNSYTQATDETWVFHMQVSGQAGSAGERRFYLEFTNTGDANEAMMYGWLVTNNQFKTQLQAWNNGTGSTQVGPTLSGTSAPFLDYAFVLIKKSDVYYGFTVTPFGGGPYMTTGGAITSVTKTGVTTFDKVCLVYSTDNTTITPISGIDFIRYYNSVTWAILNP